MEPLSVSRLLISLLVILSVYRDEVEAQSERCTLPTGTPGSCVAIQRCRNINNIVENPTPQNKKFDRYIEKIACTLPGVTRSVCCSPSEVRSLPSTSTTPRARTCNKQDLLPDNCGKTATDRIAHGNVTEVFAYPWMAVVQYLENGQILGGCAGSLISRRYVLTAAHCIKTRSTLKLHNVILGEHTKNQAEDCNVYIDNNGIPERDCAGPIETFGIESFIFHEKYNHPKFHNDIGLIRLDRDVKMKDHIKTICLPIPETLQRQAFSNYIVTGWGATHNNTGSDVLLQANLDHVETAICQQKLSNFRMNVQVGDKQFCAQGRGSKDSADSCQGDSGGPVISSANYPSRGARFVQLGIVSYGINSCGLKSSPGVYCRVASYVDWILDHMECDA